MRSLLCEAFCEVITLFVEALGAFFFEISKNVIGDTQPHKTLTRLTIRRMPEQEEYEVIDLTVSPSPIRCVRRQLVFDDDEESVAHTDTESIANTAEWLDTPSHTIGFELEHDNCSFDILDQSFLNDEVDSYPCPFESPISCK